MFESFQQVLADNMVDDNADNNKEKDQKQETESGDWVGDVPTDEGV